MAAYRAGRLPVARALCEHIITRLPDDGDARMWLGMIAMSERRWPDAIAAFDRALQIRVDPWTLVNLGACYAKAGQLEDAQYCLQSATQVMPDLVEARVELAAVLHGLRRFDEALAQLAVAEQRDASDYRIDLRRGCTLAELGRYDQAQQACKRSAVRAGRFVYPALVAFDRPAFDSIISARAAVAPPATVIDPGPLPADVQGVVLVSFNPPYARKYGFAFLRSYAEYASAGHLLHVHIFDPDEHIVAEIRRVAHKAGLVRIAVSTEASPYAVHAPQQRKAYYACGRLLHLPYWLDVYQRPILSLDADFIVEGSLDVLFEADAGKDVRLNPRRTIDSPWLDVIANVIVARPTPAARSYFTAVGRYAMKHLDAQPDAWLVDQAALFCVLKMMEQFGKPPSIGWIDEAEQSGLWHIGHAYDHLLDDARFKRYAGPA